jgi:hypothetical protein
LFFIYQDVLIRKHNYQTALSDRTLSAFHFLPAFFAGAFFAAALASRFFTGASAAFLLPDAFLAEALAADGLAAL